MKTAAGAGRLDAQIGMSAVAVVLIVGVVWVASNVCNSIICMHTPREFHQSSTNYTRTFDETGLSITAGFQLLSGTLLLHFPRLKVNDVLVHRFVYTEIELLHIAKLSEQI